MDVVDIEFVGPSGAVKASATVEIADTPETRRRGLSKRASLGRDRGMFFDTAGCYWMKDVEFPLDLAFLSKSGEVLEVQHMPVDRDGLFHYSPAAENAVKAAHALEMPMGWFGGHGITRGDVMTCREAGCDG